MYEHHLSVPAYVMRAEVPFGLCFCFRVPFGFCSCFSSCVLTGIEGSVALRASASCVSSGEALKLWQTWLERVCIGHLPRRGFFSEKGSPRTVLLRTNLFWILLEVWAGVTRRSYGSRAAHRPLRNHFPNSFGITRKPVLLRGRALFSVSTALRPLPRAPAAPLRAAARRALRGQELRAPRDSTALTSVFNAPASLASSHTDPRQLPASDRRLHAPTRGLSAGGFPCFSVCINELVSYIPVNDFCVQRHNERHVRESWNTASRRAVDDRLTGGRRAVDRP